MARSEESKAYPRRWEQRRPTPLDVEASMLARRPRLDVDGLDEGIRRAVSVLWNFGIETYESCDGGEGHSYLEPTVRFHGRQGEGFRAFGIALTNGLKPTAIRRVWDIVDGEPEGPHWEMTFERSPR